MMQSRDVNDIISICGSRILSKTKNKCCYESEQDGFITMKFIGESAENDAMNFSVIFNALGSSGVPTFLHKQIGHCEYSIHAIKLFPVFTKISAIANQSFATTFGVRYSSRLTAPITDWYFASKDLSNPCITTEYISAFNILSDRDVASIKEASHRAFNFLNGFFTAKGFALGALTLRFGQNDYGNIVIAEDISHENIELWSIRDFKHLELSSHALTEVLKTY